MFECIEINHTPVPLICFKSIYSIKAVQDSQKIIILGEHSEQVSKKTYPLFIVAYNKIPNQSCSRNLFRHSYYVDDPGCNAIEILFISSMYTQGIIFLASTGFVDAYLSHLPRTVTEKEGGKFLLRMKNIKFNLC